MKQQKTAQRQLWNKDTSSIRCDKIGWDGGMFILIWENMHALCPLLDNMWVGGYFMISKSND